MSLRLCPSCSRHVREEQCPFCGTDVPPAAASPLPRVARIALVGIGAAAVATACSSAPAYGGPPDTGTDDAATQDAGQDAIGTFYGGPPIDSGSGDSGTD